MAAKAIIHFHEKDGKKKYGLVPTIPGLFEFPFMKGGGTPMHDRLGKLWEKYHHEALGNAFAGNPTPLMRVVPVEQSLSPKNRVHPYEEVKNFILNADFIALTNCACRVSVGGCDRPKDVCLIFDGAGRFLAAGGNAREISREEGLEVLKRAEEAGLVHTSNNSSDRAGLICNCCPCCCTVLRGKTQLKHPHAFEPSRFEARVDAGSCTGCAICAEERCPVKAITMEDGIATVEADLCIGCGLCASACPAQAIELVDRKVAPAVPASIQEMGVTVAKEKGTLQEFIKIMSR
jgi:Na+-translocating ferredoxin:NAD+ oxidoreductase subunit B